MWPRWSETWPGPSGYWLVTAATPPWRQSGGSSWFPCLGQRGHCYWPAAPGRRRPGGQAVLVAAGPTGPVLPVRQCFSLICWCTNAVFRSLFVEPTDHCDS